MPFLEKVVHLSPVATFINIVDVLLVWFVIYQLFKIIKGTKAVQLLKGIFVLIIVRLLTDVFHFDTLKWLLDQVLPWGFLAIIIIFQPELRRALEQLGRGRLFARTAMQEEEEHDRLMEALSKSVNYMAKRRIGALISIERETGLSEYIETGTPLKSVVTSELLINIFIPNAPLHDGAVILHKNQIAAAGCYLPLSESPFISKELGTRHRAALGLSEVTDAITIIVSEETGAISLAIDGELYRDLSIEEFEARLRRVWFGTTTEPKNTSKWKWGVKKNG
ncbi:diadenylate cyclase CdaA [Sporosarcina sp. Marseille-Q4063]|uniref:diadenylate cyclase CdaA n=1 Tax=Sporosarcina sp. Marseille-Q4063 TaxID=2810514 RepID=UPI001BAF99CC|nr:diadenylate cyclase CdaA [Sporosarcina sp. Marseille-Q4063]QUW20328.1 diadenylate cyclase CdaA [Sporosarcina sp. Marseille-Q4063]